MNNIEVGEGVQKDGYGNIIDGTTIPPVTECERHPDCHTCPRFAKENCSI